MKITFKSNQNDWEWLMGMFTGFYSAAPYSQSNRKYAFAADGVEDIAGVNTERRNMAYRKRSFYVTDMNKFLLLKMSKCP